MSMPEAGDTTEPQGQNEEQVPIQGQPPGTASEGRRGVLFSRALESAGSLLRRLRGEQQGQDELPEPDQNASRAGQVSQQTTEERILLDGQLFGELRQLTQLKKRGDAAAGPFNDRGGEQALQVLTDAFKQRVGEIIGDPTKTVEEIIADPNSRNFREVYEFVKHIRSWEDSAKIDSSWKEDLDVLLTEADIKALDAKQVAIDTFFKREYDKMDDSVRESLFGDLERELQNGIDGLRLGQTIHDIEVMMFGGLDRYNRPELGAVRRSLHKEPENISGILEWRATKSVDGVETRVGIELLTQPPARWEEVPQKLANIYKFIEATDFTVEQLQSSVQQAIGMIQTVERNHPEGRVLLAQLNKELKAFQAFHTFRVTMERTNQNPEKVAGVFENYFDNETWKNFVERFGKDSRGRRFVATIDEEGKPIKEGKEVNLFDLAEKAYFRKLQQERKTMNLVEGLTTVSIEKKLGWREYGTIERLLRRGLSDPEKDELEGLRVMFKDGEKVVKKDRDGKDVFDENGKPVTEIKYKVKELLDKNGKPVEVWGMGLVPTTDGPRNFTKEAIREWYMNKTLLGALGKLGEQRQIMREELKKELKKQGLGIKSSFEEDKDNPARQLSDDELKALDASGFLESVDYNAYNFLWTMAWSDFDIIRVYDKQAAGKKNPMIPAVVYNESSSMFHGRIIDHPWEFLADERRGREGKEYDPNEVMRRVFPGRHHGLFERNRTLVRFFGSFVSDEQKKELGIEDKINKMMKNENLQDYDEREKEYFRSWVEGIVIGEMIDNGQVNFADPKKNFSEKTIGENAQYLMFDLFTDRGQTVKYLGKEAFQMYLADPTTENFRKINKKLTAFYSGRNIRLWPWMTLATRAHWEFNSKHALRVYRRPNMTAAGGEKFIDELIDDGDMEKKQGTVEKRRNFGFYNIGGRIKIGEWVITEKEYKLKLGKFFGTLPFRKTRQGLESLRRLGWDGRWLLLAMMGVALLEYAKRLPKELGDSLKNQ